uniref:DOMON domain-containing protein n=1 Tax=Heterorhabditis bacteriophora TaxID=37862 RepID=A0A1I7WCR9_HETBA
MLLLSTSTKQTLTDTVSGMQMKDAELIALLRIDIYRAHSAVMPQMVFTLQIRDTSEPVQLLVEHQPRSSIISPAIVDGYQLIAGVDIDHKEEVFRGITGYIDLEGIPTVSLRWKRVQNIATTVNETKSSPTIKFSWRNSLNQTVASQILRPYDSIYGTQFSILELSKLNLTTSQSGVWSVLVHDASVIAIISFPVFSTSNTAQFHSLVKEYFIVKDSCKGSSCTNIIWSTFHPDPKSDILSGYDKDLQCLV